MYFENRERYSSFQKKGLPCGAADHRTPGVAESSLSRI